MEAQKEEQKRRGPNGADQSEVIRNGRGRKMIVSLAAGINVSPPPLDASSKERKRRKWLQGTHNKKGEK